MLSIKSNSYTYREDKYWRFITNQEFKIPNTATIKYNFLISGTGSRFVNRKAV
jgi:hypothetical protein